MLPGDEPVTSLAFRADGQQLASGVGSTVQLWEPDTDASTRPRCWTPMARSPASPTAPDGTALLVAAGEQVELWNLGVHDPSRSIANPVVLDGHVGKVTAVAYSPDGHHFASASADGTARVWLPLDALIDLSCRVVGRNLSQEEWRLLLPSEPYRTTCERWPSAGDGESRFYVGGGSASVVVVVSCGA